MKQFIFSVFICFLFFHQQLFAQELKSEFLCDLEINVNLYITYSGYIWTFKTIQDC